MGRRTRRIAFTAAAASVVLASGLVSPGGNRAMRAIAGTVADPLSVLAGRSPGDRAAGALTQSKPYRTLPRLASSTGPFAPGAPGAPFVPTERVLSGGRPADPGYAFNDTPLSFGPTGLPGGLPGGGSPVGPGGNFIPLVPGGSFIPPTGGGGGGILPPDPTIPPIVPAPIPEPGTWAMMLAGFFTLGGLLRRRGRGVAALRAQRTL